MESRYEDQAEFGADDEIKDDDIQDEVVSDDIIDEDDVIDESSTDDENPDNEDEQQKPEPKKRDKAQTRINQLQRERYRALNEAEKAKAERDYWQQRYELSSQTAIRQYDANVNSRLEKAKLAQKEAYESGDAQAQAEAVAEIAAATAELQDLNNWKYQDEIERKTRPYKNETQENPNNELLNEFLQENHEWMNPESDKYDEELAEHIVNVDNQLANYLRQSGYAHRIGSLEYFQELDKHREAFLARRNKNPNQRRELNMRESRGGASPVSRGTSQSQQRNIRHEHRLTPEEREMAQIVGVDEDRYLKEKIKFMKEESLNRRGR
jgi:hypothetical protein